jgi:hypothetical protein
MEADMIKRVSSVLAVVACVAAIGAIQAQPTAHPVAVELFTSQGCSSCPPADAVMGRLVSDARVVAITRPVTYWDRLGWKDTLARPDNTALQQGYTRRAIAGAGNYTPQAVVQGTFGLVGSRGPDLLKLVIHASARPEAQIVVGKSADGGRVIRLAGKAPTVTSVTHVALKSSTTVRIGDGENGGRSVTYTNALVGERQIGAWKGGAAEFRIDPAAMRVRGADRHAVIVRAGAAGPILAARYM